MINKVILVGNVGVEPDIRTLPNGGRVANFSLATSESWKDKEGNRQEKTEWHKIVIFNNNLIQVVEKYIKKGSMLYVEGSLKSSKYTDKTGNERYTTEIVIQSYSDTLKILNSRGGETGGGSHESSKSIESSYDNFSSGGSKNSVANSSSSSSDIDDDIPF